MPLVKPGPQLHTLARFAWAFALLGVATCGEEPDVALLGAELLVPQAKLDLGQVYLTYPKTMTVNLETRGELPLDFVVQLTGQVERFTVTPAEASIPTNGTLPLSITAAPIRLGPIEIQVSILTNANRGNTSGTILVTAEGRLPPDCEDGNGCTIDRFDPGQHKCLHQVHENACDDRDRCTENDRCRGGRCLGEAIACDDGDLCTDNLCNPLSGCVFPQTRTCDDANPCTMDTCVATSGCEHESMPNGTLCDDLELCTEADVCANGRCVGIAIPDGTMCDDSDPCSTEETCQSGECIDDTYRAAVPGEVKFDTFVGTLSADAGRNPIVDRDGNVFFGTTVGLLALNTCGEILWRNDSLGEPRWRSALSLPGRLYVPVGARIIAIDTLEGTELEQLDLRTLTASTSSTAQVYVQDLVVRGNGDLLVSVKVWEQAERIDGYLVEWTPGTQDTRIRLHSPYYWSEQLAIDRDEVMTSVVTGTSSTAPASLNQWLMQYDLATMNVRWSSTSSVTGIRTHLALGKTGEVYWSTGAQFLGAGESHDFFVPTLIDPYREHGAPAHGGELLYWPVNSNSGLMSMGQTSETSELISTSTQGEIRWRRNLRGHVDGSTPVVSADGQVYILSNRGVLRGYSDHGVQTLSYEINHGSSQPYVSNPTLTRRAVLVFGYHDRIVGIQTQSRLGATPWPRVRHDNLSTGHR